MKKLDFLRYMGNIDEKYVIESENYKPASKKTIRVIALAACLAVIVAAIPLTIILNREPDTADDLPTVTDKDNTVIDNTDPDNVLPDGLYYKEMGTIQLANDKIVFNAKFLTDGKNIYANLEEDTRPYVMASYPLTELQKQGLLNETLRFAQYYHNREEVQLDMENYTGTYSMAKYSIVSNDDLIETRVQYIANDSISGVESMALYIKGSQVIDYRKDADDNVENIYNCIKANERYFQHVLRVNELSDKCCIEINELSKDSLEYSMGATYQMVVTIELDPLLNQRQDKITLTFYTDASDTCDGSYYLSEITTQFSLSGQVELIDEETAYEWLLRGICIGDIGQFDNGCSACCIKGGLTKEDRIPENVECSLVYIPEVEFVSGDESITYAIPFYAFTVPAENGSTSRVSFVPAIEITGLDEILKDANRAECVYRDHQSGSIKTKEDYTGILRIIK